MRDHGSSSPSTTGGRKRMMAAPAPVLGSRVSDQKRSSSFFSNFASFCSKSLVTLLNRSARFFFSLSRAPIFLLLSSSCYGLAGYPHERPIAFESPPLRFHDGDVFTPAF